MAKGDGPARSACPAGSSDPVDIIFGRLGKVIVDDAGDGIDVKTSGGNIRGNKDPRLASPEAGQDPVSLGLALVSMKGVTRESLPEKGFRQFFSPTLCPGEDQGLSFGSLGFGEEGFEKPQFLGPVADGDNLLVD